ncbi:MAG: NAD(P)H-binding protein [Bacteroidetes bacterium]|nr:NAD(P)H-binding protein [Bacteroidota bacterium]
MKVKAIITGATGMVGEGVLKEALRHPDVESVLIINRQPSGFRHPRLKEIVHKDFFDLTPVEDQLAGYNAVFFNLGVSSVGMKEDEYRHMTYDLTMNFARTVAKKNEDVTFIYISGAGTDSTEQGSTMWARVKGKTENDLMKLFKKAYAFRPGIMRPEPDSKNIPSWYKYLGWLYSPVKLLAPNVACELPEVGRAMINAVTKGYDKHILEVRDIIELSKR